MTKSQEVALFERFQEKYIGIPTGRVEFGDKPDIILKLANDEKIGIELTECVYNEILMNKSEFQIKFNQRVIEQLEACMPFKFELDIELDTEYPLRQNRRQLTIDEIIKVCVSEFQDLNHCESRHVEKLNVIWDEASFHVQQHFRGQGFRTLPDEISRIRMTRFDNLKRSWHPESKGGTVPDFTQESLNAILFKKEKALTSYTTCNQQWLVIGEGSDFYSYVDAINIEKGFETKFDKVFMYRWWNSEVITFK